MKNKFLIILLTAVIVFSGCNKIEKENEKIEETKKIQKEIIKEPEYKDENTTPISFYIKQDNKLIKINEISKKLNVLDVIDTYYIYPSYENEIVLNKSFAESFYDEWQKYNPNNNIKIGFNLKFKTINENISYNILTPSNTFDRAEYIMNYLYDAYANRNKSFYSHLEEDEYNDSTLFTLLKIQCGEKWQEILNPIQITVYTYDSEDDFENNEYRGNSKSTFTINIEK